MSAIKVDPDELLQMSGRIENAIAVGDECRDKHGMLANEAAAAGRGDVADAIASFMQAWSYGLECINKDGETLVRFLQRAGSSYKQAEAAVAKAASVP